MKAIIAVFAIATAVEYLWFRRAQRRRRRDLLQRRIEEASRESYVLTPTDMVMIQELAESAHRSPNVQ